MLTGCLCGTCFHEIPYNVGVKHPYGEGTIASYSTTSYKASDDVELQECRLADRRRRCFLRNQELYRIGSDYYVKTEIVYTPVTKRSYTWSVLGEPKDFPVDDASRQEKATYFCRVDEHWQQNEEWLQAEHLPRLTNRRQSNAPLLTEEEAMALNPVFIKKLDSCIDIGFASISTLEPRYSWPHYAMLPVTAATFTLIDLPCDIIGSTGAAIILVISGLFNW